MDDQSNNTKEQSEPKTWREERWARRQARRAALGGRGTAGALVAGLLLVILGVVFLLQNSGNIAITFKNWGALFILIPAVVAFDRGYRYYRSAQNRLVAQSRGAIFVGIILIVVMLVILLNLNWTIWGPVLIIVVGAGLLLNTFLKG